jgi:hypothetical protein
MTSPDRFNHTNPPIGHRFSRLTVLSYAGMDRTYHHHMWKMACDCGRETEMYSGNVISGKSKQCKWCGWKATVRTGRPRLNGKRDDMIADLFRKGATVDDISRVFGLKRGGISAAIDRMRNRGVDVSRSAA